MPSIKSLDDHGIVICAAEHVTIDLKEVEGFPANAEKFAVLVEDDGVAEPEWKDDFHDRGGVCCGVRILDRFHRSERAHAAGGDQIM